MKTTTVVFNQPTRKNVCSNAGSTLPALVATKAGVADAIDQVVPHLARGRTHTSGRVITAMACALACGGDDVSDIALMHPLHAHGLVDSVSSAPTAHRRFHELSACDFGELVSAIGLARRRVWEKAGWANPARRASVHTPLIIDLDATVVPVHSEKQNAAPTWKKTFGYHPLVAMVDYGDDTGGEVLVPLLRPGNAGANTAMDHKTALDLAITAIGGNIHADGEPFGRRLVVRCDGGGGTKQFINHIHAQGHGFVVGFRMGTPLIAGECLMVCV